MTDARGDADRRRLEGHAALVFVQLCFGLFPLFTLRAVESFAPRTVVFWRIAFGSVVLGALAFLLYGKRLVPRRRDLPRLLLCSLFGVLANQVMAIEGIARSTSTNAGLLMTLIPIFTFTLAAAVGQEPLSLRRGAGIVVAMAGALVLLLARGGAPELAGARLFGNILIATNCLSFSIYLLISRDLLQRYPPLVLIALVYFGATLGLPFVAMGQDLVPAAPTTSASVALAYTLVFPTVIAYLLNTLALARVSASTTAVYIYLQPLVAAAAGVAVLDEALRPRVFVSAALLFLGIWLVIRRPVAQPLVPGEALDSGT
jgi:drug/metabolite transporter (DMT)-like permease